MYWWKTTFNPSLTEVEFLNRHKVRTLYLRIMDLDHDPAANRLYPRAPLEWSDNFPVMADTISIVPVLFITREAIASLSVSDTDSVAALLAGQLRGIETAIVPRIKPAAHVREWQIDCDWTARTAEAYFSLLSALRRYMPHNTLLSVTLRLYPYKYRQQMGVPPADRVMLMCYNMGKLRHPATHNSILDLATLREYLDSYPYPLPADVALPIFDWYVWFSQGRYRGLLYPEQAAGLSVQGRDKHQYELLKDTVLNQKLLKKGDILRYEPVSSRELTEAVKLVKPLLSRKNRLTFFHLDSTLLKKYSERDWKTIYNTAR